ncbi:adenylate kinase [uncultured Paludibaculum sp.]|uniref:adenylate kinase n=1 Tax=uncultured Paludibaculum sp. TaxID=1765020 RepID=UPI002AABE715|nr:adenylate kinase [uncultured Paludibaculum sp.]
MTTATESLTQAPATTRILLLLGPPGCGKGTQAERLAKHFEIPAISTGEMIRAEIKAGSELGKIAAGVTITGGLLSDDLVNKIVRSRLGQEDCKHGFMLDGYPRTVEQAKYLGALLSEMGFPQPTVVHIDVPAEHLIARTCNRRYCPQCHAIYNIQSHPPKDPGKCDNCHIDLQQRSDDCEDTVKNRLAAYVRSTSPLIDFYSTSTYYKVQGLGAPDEVFQTIQSHLS